MKYIKSLFISIACIAISSSAIAQYAPVYDYPLAGPFVMPYNPIPNAVIQSGSVLWKSNPTAVSYLMSYDNPGESYAANGWHTITGSSTIYFQNSMQLAVAIGSEPNAPDGIVQLGGVPNQTSQINLDSLWIGTKVPGQDPKTHAIINTEYDTLIVDRLWIAPGAHLEIIGQYPLIIREELHNKGTLVVHENLLLPVNIDTEHKGLHAMFEQKGTVIGRYSTELLLNERPEFINWDWVVENFGAGATYLDSVMVQGWNPSWVEYWIEQSHITGIDEDNINLWLQALLDDDVDQGTYLHPFVNPTVKGVRYGPAYGDHQRIAMFKDQYGRLPMAMKFAKEGGVPNGFDIFDELADEIAAVWINASQLNFLHNNIINQFYDPNAQEDLSENVHWLMPEGKPITYYRTRYQYNYADGSPTGYWIDNPPAYMSPHPDYPNLELPWADGDVQEETGYYINDPDISIGYFNGGTGQIYTNLDQDFQELFVQFDYCRDSDALFYAPDSGWYDINLLPPNWVDNGYPVSPALDTVYASLYGGCADTLTAFLGLFDVANSQETGQILWNFRLMNSPDDNLWDYDAIGELDTTVAGYDTIYDHQWFYRNEPLGQSKVFHGWEPYFWQNPGGTFDFDAYTWFDFETGGSNGNQCWEHPNKMFFVDTIGRQTASLYNLDVSNLPIDSLNFMYLMPTLEESYGDHPYLSNYIQYYPFGTRLPRVQTNISSDWWGARWTSVDQSTPQPFPYGVTTTFTSLSNTETIDRHEGYSWMNTLDAYDHPDMAYHPDPFNEGILIPNLPPNNSGDHSLQYHLPTANDWVYVYAPNGLLYEQGTWSECTTGSYTDANGDTLDPITYCINYFTGNNQAYTSSNIAVNTGLTDLINYSSVDLEDIPDDWSAFGNPYIKRNRFQLLANPLHGYLDVDKVADRYFQLYPESNHLEFAWWNSHNTTGTSNIDIGNVVGAQRSYWRRKYHRYGDEIVSNEVEFFLDLLYDQFVATGGQGFSAEVTNVLLSFLGDAEGGIQPGSPVHQWLATAPVNPMGYVPLGKYMMPGAAFFARNSSGSPAFLDITSDMGIYDFDMPYATGDTVYFGSNGPGTTGTGYGERSANAAPGFDFSSIICLDVVSDSAYFPWMMLQHEFKDDATNGSEQIHEDNQASLPNFPYIFTDSLAVRPSTYVEEYGPHNHEPMFIHIPQPLDSGMAFCIFPLAFQNQGAQWYEEAQTNIYTRFGIELFDTNGDITNIIYLDRGDTLWIRHEDPYEWPIHGKVYFTDLVGDTNGDGIVNIGDLLTILALFNLCEDEVPEIAYYDLNGDGCYTTSDMLIVLAVFGATIGDEVGEFGDNIYWNGPERLGGRPDNWPVQEITDGFNGIRSIREVAQVSATNEITLFGEQIQIFDIDLKIVASGINSVVAPSSGGPYFVISDRTYGKWDPTEVPPAVSTVTVPTGAVSDADGNSVNQIQTVAAAYPAGANQFWIDFYSDVKTFDGNYDANNEFPTTLAQLYYGINSGNSAVASNASNAKIEGLIDIFGAGLANNAYTLDDARGAYTDDRFSITAEAYKNFKTNRNDPLFEPTFVPMAFVADKNTTVHHPDQVVKGIETNTKLDRVYADGVVNEFDVFSELSGKREPGITEWGGDIKEFNDYEIYNGVIAMCDFMSLKDYFTFKMYDVSPKFGQVNPGSALPRSTNESFGTPYSTGAAEGVSNITGVGFAPSKCNTLAEYTTQIITPFIAANIGNPTVLPQDPVPVTQDGIQRNSDNAGHHNWFGNAPAFQFHNSFGPLVYDFNMDGTYTADDLTIWNGLVAKWEADGDIPSHSSGYESASYYRPLTDALNEVVNVIPVYNPESTYDASWKFNDWFDASATQDPFGYVNNWWQCLNQPEWNLNLYDPTLLTVDAFGGNGTLDDSFLYNPTRTGFNDDLLTPVTFNNYGKIAVLDYATEAQLLPYSTVPSDNYFPVTKYWQP